MEATTVVDVDAPIFPDAVIPEPVSANQKQPQLNLTFRELKYCIRKNNQVREIMNGISGSVWSGSMMCILGPSGSGKTSLLQIISRKLLDGPGREISGVVQCNGVEPTATQFQRISGMVTQEDVFNAALTVSETLRFVAKLKLKSKHMERIEKVTQKLQLDSCLNTYVGDDTNPYLKGISGGEKRRLAIALEILDPNISLLVLDEPTSGLDSAAALNVANILRNLADADIAVAATLHQPRSMIVEIFDKLMILTEGRRAFYGMLDKYMPYLEMELQSEVPKHENPYDFFLDALNPLIRNQSKRNLSGKIPHECENVSQILVDIFDRSSLRKQMDEVPTDDSYLPPIRNISSKTFKELLESKRSDIGWCLKFAALLQRTLKIKMRDPLVLMTLVSSAVMLGLIFGAIYWQGYDKAKKFVISDVQMAITMTVVMCVFLPYDVVITFPLERKIFLRERKAGMYSTSCFFLARILADMPIHILSSSLFSLIMYSMGGLRMGVHLFIFVNTSGILVGAAIMQMAGALCRTMDEANILALMIMMMCMILSGGFIREVPGWLDWARQASVNGIVADLGMYWEFRNVDAVFGEASQVLANYGCRIRNDDDLVKSLLILLAVYVASRVITFLAVKFLHTNRSLTENLWD